MACALQSKPLPDDKFLVPSTPPVLFNRNTMTTLEFCGSDLADVQGDLDNLRSGAWTTATLLDTCLNGVDPDDAHIIDGWTDYVRALATATYE